MDDSIQMMNERQKDANMEIYQVFKMLRCTIAESEFGKFDGLSDALLATV